MCTFTTDHLSYFGFINVISTPIVTYSTSSSVTGPGGGYSTPLSNSIDQISSSFSLGIPALTKLLQIGQNTPTKEAQKFVQEPSIFTPIDVRNNIHKKSIILFMKKGYIQNTLMFYPIRTMTRAEFIKIIALANGFVEPLFSTVGFNDVPETSDFAKYIAFAGENGWINTIQKNFRPNDKITLWEAMKVLSNITGNPMQNFGSRKISR